MLESFRYFIFRAVRNMRQWPLLCTASVLTMAIALATVATFFLVVVNIEQLAQRWTAEIQVVAYLDSPPSADALPGLIREIKAFKEVEGVNYVSQQDAMARFKNRLGEDESLLEGISYDVLPASFEIALHEEFRTQEGVSLFIEKLQGALGASDLRYGQEWLQRFNRFVQMLRYVGMILGGFLLLAALFIVSNTIKLTLYARRDELEIMALVGATMRFIKIPFMLEGALQGLLGGGLSLVFLGLSYSLIIARSVHGFWLTPTDFDLTFLTFGQQLLLVFSGALLGTLGSLSSLRRFVRI